jgi:Uma2 family endonuclease
MAFPQLEQTNYTYADYLQWDEGRWELIDGEVWDMTPAPSRVHQEIAGDIFYRIYDYLKNRDCKAYIAPFDVSLPDTDTAGEYETFTVVQPDISVICDLNKLNDRGCKGAPDLVVEILSPSTAAKDLKVKRALYEKHGVKEYWLVHPTDKVVMVYVLHDDNHYHKAEIFDREDTLNTSLFEDFEINLSDIFSDSDKE